jgi:hypothetical protein
MYLFLLFISLLHLHYVTPMDDDYQRHNVLFRAINTIHVTRQQWIISLPINTSDYVLALHQLQSNLQDTLHNSKNHDQILVHRESINHTSPLHQSYHDLIHNEENHLEHLLYAAQSLHNEYLDLNYLHSMPTPISKRSLLPILGDALHSLFGVARDKDISHIHDAINKLERSTTQLRHITDQSLSVLNSVASDVQHHRQTINTLIDVSQSLNNTLTQLETEIVTVLLPFKQITMRFLQLHATYASFEIAFSNFKQHLSQLSHILSNLFHGNLSPALVKPALLRTTLRQIKFRLPSMLTLPFDPDDNIYRYYQLIHTTCISTHYGFLALLHVPLADASSAFTVYAIRHIPVPFPSHIGYHNFTITYDVPHDFLAVSRDHTQLMFLSEFDIQFCTHNAVHFCPIQAPIYSVAFLHDDCAAALFS